VNLSDAIAAALRPAVRAALALDPDAASRVERLGDAVLEVRVTGLRLSLFAIPEGRHLRIAATSAAAPAARISGPPASLARLATTAGTRVLFAGNLRVEGDMQAAKAWKRLFDTLDPDWEEALAQAVGDVPAHEAGRLARGVAAWGRRAGRGRQADVAAWLVDEIECLPARAEVERWLGAVDRARADADRLAARVARLERHRGTAE